MSALPEVIPFALPARKPRVVQRESEPDKRKVVVLPIRAVFDQKLTHGALQVLAAVCAYANRAGITWVSQTRLAKDLGISQQAVAKQFKQLRECGYLETVRKGFKGERTDTLRVIFDPSVDVATAIAVTSPIEDTRSPVMKKEQEMQEVYPEGQRRIARMLAQALTKPVTKKELPMPKAGDSRAVRQVKEANKKALEKRKPSAHNHNLQVVNEDGSQVVIEPVDNSSHSQPGGCAIHNPGVVQNTERTHIVNNIKVNNKENVNNLNIVKHNLNNEQIEKLFEQGLNETQIGEHLEVLLAAYKAEGLTPKPDHLLAGIMQLHRDVR